jgi:hypothetical protein
MPMEKESSKFTVVKPILVSIGHLRISTSSQMALLELMSITFVTIWLWIGRMGWMDVTLENRDISLSSSCITKWRRAKCRR